jgi:hypothetical protein
LFTKALFGMHIVKMALAPNDWSPLPQGVMRFWSLPLYQWLGIQTNAGAWNWSYFDACTNAVRSNQPNCKILYTLGQTPAWAALTTNTPVKPPAPVPSHVT